MSFMSSYCLKPYSYKHHHATLQSKCGKLEQGEQVSGMMMYVVDNYLEPISRQVICVIQALYDYQANESWEIIFCQSKIVLCHWKVCNSITREFCIFLPLKQEDRLKTLSW